MPVKTTADGQQNFSFSLREAQLMWIDHEKQRVLPDGTLDFAFFTFELPNNPEILNQF